MGKLSKKILLFIIILLIISTSLILFNFFTSSYNIFPFTEEILYVSDCQNNIGCLSKIKKCLCQGKIVPKFEWISNETKCEGIEFPCFTFEWRRQPIL